jgi:hypothetical protein
VQSILNTLALLLEHTGPAPASRCPDGSAVASLRRCHREIAPRYERSSHPSGFPTRRFALLRPQRRTGHLAAVIEAEPAPRERPDPDRRRESRPTLPASVALVPRSFPQPWPSGRADSEGTGRPILPTGWTERLQVRATPTPPPDVGRIPPIGALPPSPLTAALFCRYGPPSSRGGGAKTPPSSAIRSTPTTVGSFARSARHAANSVGSFARFPDLRAKPVGSFRRFPGPRPSQSALFRHHCGCLIRCSWPPFWQIWGLCTKSLITETTYGTSGDSEEIGSQIALTHPAVAARLSLSSL